MIVRVRNNYGQWKINLGSSTSPTVEMLLNAIHTQYNVNLSAIQLKTENGQIISMNEPNLSLVKEYGIKHGDLLIFTNKLKQVVVDKNRIEEGKLIAAGTSYVEDEEDKVNEKVEEGSNTAAIATTNNNIPVNNNNPIHRTIVPSSVPAPAVPAPAPAAPAPLTQQKEASPVQELDQETADYDFDDSFQEPDIRPPDESKKICLLGGDEDDEEEDDPRSLHFPHNRHRHNSHDDDPSYLIHSMGYNYRPNSLPYQGHLPAQEPEPTVDPEVINQMREAGLTENQIQEQIDYLVAQKMDQQQALHASPLTEYDHYMQMRRNHFQEPFNSGRNPRNRIGDAPYGVGIGTSTRTRADRIGLRDPHVGPPYQRQQPQPQQQHHQYPQYPQYPRHSPIDTVRYNQIDQRLAEMEEKELMEAINRSKEESATTEQPNVTDSNPTNVVSNTTNNPYDFRRQLEGEHEHEQDDDGDDEYDPALELALKMSLESQKLEDTKKQQKSTKESPKSQVLSRDQNISNRNRDNNTNNNTNQKSDRSSTKPSRDGQQSLGVQGTNSFTTPTTTRSSSTSKSTKSSTKTTPPSIDVSRISTLSQGPARAAPARPSSAHSSRPGSANSVRSTNSSSSIHSSHGTHSLYSSSMDKGTPRQTPRGSSSSKPSPRDNPRNEYHQQISTRMPVDRTSTESRSTQTSKSSRGESGSAIPEKYDNEMLDHAVALSLAEVMEKEETRPQQNQRLIRGTTHQQQPSSQGLRNQHQQQPYQHHPQFQYPHYQHQQQHHDRPRQNPSYNTNTRNERIQPTTIESNNSRIRRGLEVVHPTDQLISPTEDLSSRRRPLNDFSTRYFPEYNDYVDHDAAMELAIAESLKDANK